MFTGIIEKVARVRGAAAGGAAGRISVENPFESLPAGGESVSVNGACLTVISANEAEISFDVSAETLEKTNLAALRPGARVNLERALKVGGDISGHLVQGHVDATGEVRGLKKTGEFAELSVRLPRELLKYIVPKGSVAVDGVSLTVADIAGDVFTVAVIPETLSRTTIGERRPGDRVNIETDVIGKYVVRYLENLGGAAKGKPITMKRLEELGL